MKKIVLSTIILLSAVLLLYYSFSGKISLFIHPRYNLFTYFAAISTLIAAIVALIFYGIDYYREIRSHKSITKPENSILSTFLLFSIVLSIGFFYPLKPISSATLEQRSNEINLIQERSDDFESFITNTKQYGINDWNYVLQTDPDWESYAGDEASIEGFIFHSEEMGSEFFLISKFVISCCAVDARPVGLPVKMDDWESKFSVDDWIRIDGEMQVAEYDGRERIVLVPESIVIIDQPDNPYLY
jgi:uncharacterized repeat protein (TIGR03943 family)